MGNLKIYVESLQNLMKKQDMDFIYLSSFDNFLSEYVPLEDSFRFHMTGFTGSVAEGLIPKEGKIKLYVDGRYHEQADGECDLDVIEVVKVPFGETLFAAMEKDLGEKVTLGNLASRTPQGHVNRLSQHKWVDLDEAKVFELVEFKPVFFKGPLWEVPTEYTGLTVRERSQKVLERGEYAFINALDTLAWFSNLRGHHLPFQGTFRSIGLATTQGLLLFVEDEMLMEISNFSTTERKVLPLEKFRETLEELPPAERVWWDAGSTTRANYQVLFDIFGDLLANCEEGYHTKWQAKKNEAEIQAFKESFEKSDQAIYDTLEWLIERTRSGEKISELQFREKADEIYAGHGAKTQSFKTIAGFGANGSIIHYGKPSDKKFHQIGENVLMDSGAIYLQGLATDCTRTIVPNGRPFEDQKKNYTLVLKGLIALMSARFKKGTLGKELDAMARAALKEHGLDYAHGTGHGVGVNVHEAGFSIRPESTVPMQAGLVGSIEPGCYIPGVGGIRLENIAIVVEDEKDKDYLRFENLVHIGFWPDLIDETLLTQGEKDYLREYEALCADKGRSFSRFSLH